MVKILKVLMILAISLSPLYAASKVRATSSSEAGKEVKTKLRLRSNPSDGMRSPSNMYVKFELEEYYTDRCLRIE